MELLLLDVSMVNLYRGKVLYMEYHLYIAESKRFFFENF